MAIGCDLRRLRVVILGAVLDTLPPIPDSALPLAQEGSERLREIVEGFFFRVVRRAGSVYLFVWGKLGESH
jgi:hypothetical protein